MCYSKQLLPVQKDCKNTESSTTPEDKGSLLYLDEEVEFVSRLFINEPVFWLWVDDSKTFGYEDGLITHTNRHGYASVATSTPPSLKS